MPLVQLFGGSNTSASENDSVLALLILSLFQTFHHLLPKLSFSFFSVFCLFSILSFSLQLSFIFSLAFLFLSTLLEELKVPSFHTNSTFFPYLSLLQLWPVYGSANNYSTKEAVGIQQSFFAW
jgi:hypothetical protein